MPDELSLHILANADAAKAGDALHHIHLDMRMGGVQRDLPTTALSRLDRVFAKQAMKFLIGLRGCRQRRDVRSQPPQHCVPEGPKRGRVRRNPHPVAQRRSARNLRMGLPFNFDAAEPASP